MRVRREARSVSRTAPLHLAGGKEPATQALLLERVESFITIRIHIQGMLTAKEIIRRVEEHRAERRGFGVKRLRLFGSYARGEAGPRSDIDFLVGFKPGRGDYDDYAGLLHLLRSITGRRVDLVKTKLVREELRESILEGRQIEAKM